MNNNVIIGVLISNHRPELDCSIWQVRKKYCPGFLSIQMVFYGRFYFCSFYLFVPDSFSIPFESFFASKGDVPVFKKIDSPIYDQLFRLNR